MPDVPLVMPGDMLLAAKLLLPKLCRPAKPLSELLDVDRDPDRDAAIISFVVNKAGHTDYNITINIAHKGY